MAGQIDQERRRVRSDIRGVHPDEEFLRGIWQEGPGAFRQGGLFESEERRRLPRALEDVRARRGACTPCERRQ